MKNKKTDNNRDSFGETVVRGSLWMFAGRWSVRGLRFGMRLVLARLLAPAAFGIVATAEAIIGFARFISGLGQGNAALYYQDQEEHTETSCSMVLFSRIFIYGLLFVSAPPLLKLLNFDLPEIYSTRNLIQVVRVLGLTVLLGGLQFFASTVLKREMKFPVLSISGMLGTIITVPTAILLAWYGFGYWSLVFSGLAGIGTTTVISFAYAIPYIRIRFRWEAIKKLIGYGLFPLLGGFSMYTATNFDDLIVGKLAGIEMLGFYWMGYSVGVRMLTDLTSPIEKVIFPVLTRMKDNLERFRTRFVESWGYVSFVAIPAGTGLYLVAPSLTIVGFSARWEPMIPIIQIFAIYVILRLIGGWKSNVFEGRGKPFISFLSSLVFLVLCLGSMYFTVNALGITGAAVSFLLARIVTFFFTLFLTAVELKTTITNLLLPHAKPFMCSAIMGLAVISVRNLVRPDHFQGLLLLIVTGVISYTGLSFLMMKNRIYKIFDLLKSNG